MIKYCLILISLNAYSYSNYSVYKIDNDVILQKEFNTFMNQLASSKCVGKFLLVKSLSFENFDALTDFKGHEEISKYLESEKARILSFIKIQKVMRFVVGKSLSSKNSGISEEMYSKTGCVAGKSVGGAKFLEQLIQVELFLRDRFSQSSRNSDTFLNYINSIDKNIPHELLF